jgi:dephospho-CoA kinase
MQIMTEQIGRQERLKGAHDIIKNEGSMSELEQQIEQLHRQYQQLASEKQRKNRD